MIISYSEDHVIARSNSQITIMEVFDMQGHLVDQIPSNSLAAVISSGLSNGTYVLRATFKSGQIEMKKFVIK